MSIDEARRRHEQAKEQGRSCRRNGGKRDACPYRAGTSSDQRDAWHAGWDEENQARRVRR